MQTTDLARRNLLTAGMAALATTRLNAQSQPQPKPRQEMELVKAFVIAGHADANLAKVKDMLQQDPKLATAAWDWGAGDWETALGGSGHMGAREMAHFLLENGARIDAFCAAMLGRRDLLGAVLAFTPEAAKVLGPHGFTLLYHAALSGQVGAAELIKPHLEEKSLHYNQALRGAVGSGHIEMTSWLLRNGVTNPNQTDFAGKRPLTVATDKGFREIAEELRKFGAE